MVVVITWRLVAPGATVPRMARLFASVPLPVKTISAGFAPRSLATLSRACSTLERARWPAEWIELALRNSAEKYGVNAARTAESTGVQALKSRYMRKRERPENPE